ncbi:MAG: cell wall hydrolase [Schaedlerella sp.]|nr:cell wall hydrolase [Lachnospiraceae bacterium]MDY4202094.1 cell wall hydrolase [Schaedlerella sp.]
MKMDSKRWLKKGTALVCSLAVVFSSSFVYADDIPSLEEKTSDLENELKQINQDMLNLSEEISATEMQIELTNSEIRRTQSFLEEARAEENQQYKDMKIRIKYMYETGNATLLEMLFSAENMTDFLNKADFIQNVSEYDRSMLDELRETREEIASQEENLQQGKESLLKLEEELNEQQKSLEEKAKATSTDLANFTAQLEQLKKEEEERLAEEARKAAEEQYRKNNSQNPVTDGTVIRTDDTLSVSSDDLTVLAAIIQCEAYHEYNYMLAVATVIMNRVESPRFPNTIPEVVYAPGQFAPTWLGSMEKALQKGPTDLAYQVAQDALNGARLAEVSDCYYFLAESEDVQGVNVGGNVFFAVWPTYSAKSVNTSTSASAETENNNQ